MSSSFLLPTSYSLPTFALAMVLARCAASNPCKALLKRRICFLASHSSFLSERCTRIGASYHFSSHLSQPCSVHKIPHRMTRHATPEQCGGTLTLHNWGVEKESKTV